MTLKELMFDVALVGDCGTFEKIKDNGWESEEDFLKRYSDFQDAEWKTHDDGRKSMLVKNPTKIGGWACKIVVLDGWVATYNYTMMEQKMHKRKIKEIHSNSDHGDDNWDDDEGVTEDYGLEDYNEDYGWWR